MKARSQPHKPRSLVPEAAALAPWFQETSRPLPWRLTYDPYHIWVSEVMLQQTQVETALPYYERFVERFPTIRQLADCREEEVLRLWSGLGYYNRARNLKRAAERVVSELAGRIPDTYPELIALPGIGRYMAGALLSIAFNKPYPVVDGNVRRVLSRLHGWREPTESAIWNAAESIAKSGEPRVVNQAMMDLGAMVCSPRAPRCPACPWRPECVAFRSGAPAEIPAARKRPRIVDVELHAVIDQTSQGILMRPQSGLWEFPLLTEPPQGAFQAIGTCRHVITHHRIRVQVYAGKLSRTAGFQRVEFDRLPVTSLTRKIHRMADRGSASDPGRN